MRCANCRQMSQPRLQVRGVDLDDHAGHKPVDELFGQLPNHLGMGVGNQDDCLPARLIVLKVCRNSSWVDGLLAKKVRRQSPANRLPHAASKDLQFFRLQGQHKLVGKVLGGQVQPLVPAVPGHAVADALEQMVLPTP